MATVVLTAQLDCAVATEELVPIGTIPTNYRYRFTLRICNRLSDATSYRVRHVVAGAASDDKQFLWYDYVITPKDTHERKGLVMGAGDLLYIYAEHGDLSVSTSGILESP